MGAIWEWSLKARLPNASATRAGRKFMITIDRSNGLVKPMADVLEYQASDAKAKWAELLDEVERGRTVRITRHGKTIARIVPEAEVRAGEVAEAIARLKALSRTFGKAPLDEVLASRHEARKY